MHRCGTNVRMISNFVASHKPVGYESIIGIIERSEVGHFGGAAIGILTMSKELVYCIECIGLNSIICRENDEHRDV